jgi:predicted phage tail component-like protein
MMSFTYNSLNSLTDFSLVAKSVNRPILPSLRKNEISIAGKHGTWDFGSNVYDNRIVTVEIQYIGTSVVELRSRARDIAYWLSSTSYKQLIFDDEADKYYLAKIYESVDFESLWITGKAQIKFECQPMALSTTLMDVTISL